jgi:ribonuclease Z
MSIEFQILGEPGRDNALLVRIDSGQGVTRLLFDCGAGCLESLSRAEVAAIDHVFFSHFHMDHVCGFDAFFRVNYSRQQPVRVWGPAGAIEILHHRFRGFVWNLVAGAPGEWYVSEVDGERVRGARFLTREAFATAYPEGERRFEGAVLDTPELVVEARVLEHGIPSLGYLVREKPRRNIDPRRLALLGLEPGPWLQAVKDPQLGDDEALQIGTRGYLLGDLRRSLMRTRPGDSVAYLTDFSLDESAAERLEEMLKGCRVLVCESQYLAEDAQLARRYFHLTAGDAARLARRCGVDRLILFHLSDRYDEEARGRFLAEARAVFAESHLPREWSRRSV